MTRRIAIAVLDPPTWCPPGVDPTAWRLALAEDVLDVLAMLAEVDGAVAIAEDERQLAGQVGWPGLAVLAVKSLDLPAIFAAAYEQGYEQAALIAADAPDLPGLTIAKLLRPLSSRPLAAAPAIGAERGLLGLAAALPAPSWLPDGGLDEHTPQSLRASAPQVTDVAPASGWHRIRGPADLARLDPRLEGWDATRAILGG